MSAVDTRGGPYYCHLNEICDHQTCDDGEDFMGEASRGWYSIGSEDQS